MRAIEVGLRFLVQQGVKYVFGIPAVRSMLFMTPCWTSQSLSRLSPSMRTAPVIWQVPIRELLVFLR